MMLDLDGWPCLVVGGGPVGARRAQTLAVAGARVTLVAPVLSARARALTVTLRERGFELGDLAGVRLVVVATDRPEVNEQVARQARDRGVLVNRADAGPGGDVTWMATRRSGPLTVAVDSGGVASASGALADTALAAIGPHWPVMLAAARQRRAALRGRPVALRRLTDGAALDILKRCGPEALAAHLDAVVAAAVASPGAG